MIQEPICEGMCKEHRRAVIELTMEKKEGPVLKAVVMKLCAECAAPIVKGREAHQHYSAACKR